MHSTHKTVRFSLSAGRSEHRSPIGSRAPRPIPRRVAKQIIIISDSESDSESESEAEDDAGESEEVDGNVNEGNVGTHGPDDSDTDDGEEGDSEAEDSDVSSASVAGNPPASVDLEERTQQEVYEIGTSVTGRRLYGFHTPAGYGTTTQWSRAGSAIQGPGGGYARRMYVLPPQYRNRKAYAVFQGRDQGITVSWDQACFYTNGFPGQISCGFDSVEQAHEMWEFGGRHQWLQGPDDPRINLGAEFHPIPDDGVIDDQWRDYHTELNQICDSPSRKWYIVYKGVVPGIYMSYPEAMLNTSQIPGSLHNSEKTLAEARAMYMNAVEEGDTDDLDWPEL